MAVDRDRDRLETILKLIADLERRLGGMDFGTFSRDGDEIDLTAFRLSAIGENAGKLPAEIKARHPTLPWKAMSDDCTTLRLDGDAGARPDQGYVSRRAGPHAGCGLVSGGPAGADDAVLARLFALNQARAGNT